jgi:hypothetical protein
MRNPQGMSIQRHMSLETADKVLRHFTEGETKAEILDQFTVHKVLISTLSLSVVMSFCGCPPGDMGHLCLLSGFVRL